MEVAGANRRWRLPFRCRGSRRESAVAQLFSLGIKIGLRFYRADWFGEDLSSSIWMSKLSAVRLGSARAGLCGEQVRSAGLMSVWICLILL
jgi:hypothetical protein